ncbi:MAG: acetylglutamate kinase [Methanomassiliicoccales archaeon]
MSGSIQRTLHDIDVVKASGSLLTDNAFAAALADYVEYTHGRTVLVNGGGKEIDALCARLSLPVVKRQGLRVTTPEVMDAVLMSLSHSSCLLASALLKHGTDVLPMPAFSGRIALSSRREGLGLVGGQTQVDGHKLLSIIDAGFVPLLYPVAFSTSHEFLNVNADELAAAVAASLGARRLLLLTDVEGIMADGAVLPSVSERNASELVETGKIVEGMLPKVTAALKARMSGVREVRIMKGGIEELKAIKEGRKVGTEIEA